jgi:class 3 adenylate cyclase
MDDKIHDIIERYFYEADGGIVQKAPSRLNRGEGTEINYYIYKIDLVASTLFTQTRTRKTYLQLAHTFLSAIHDITWEYGAEDDQTEYAGDSVIAYFRTDEVDAVDVLEAAYYCRKAALEIRKLDETLKRFPFNTKTIIHSGKLVMAKIGPRGSWRVSAIGPELHKACKMEKNVLPGEGRVSKEFMGQLVGRQKLLLKANYKEKQVLKLPEITPKPRGLSPLESPYPYSSAQGITGMAPMNIMADSLQQRGIASPQRNALTEFATSVPKGVPEPQYVTERELVDYSINWDMIPKFLETQGR